MRYVHVLCVAVCLLASCHRIIELGDARAITKERKAGKRIIKSHPILFHFVENDHDFDSLIGANFRKGAYAEAFIKNSFTQFQLTAGWVYLAGKYPFVRTPLVETIARGTSYAVEIDGSTQRVYLLSDGFREAVDITLLPGVQHLTGATTTLRLTKQHYATIAPDAGGIYSIVDSGPIPPDPAVAPFMTELRAAVDTAGLISTWPANIP